MKPKLFTALGNEILYYSYYSTNFTDALPLGTNGAPIVDTSGGQVSITNGNKIIFPYNTGKIHYFLIIYHTGATANVAFDAPIANAFGMTLIDNFSAPANWRHSLR